MHDPFEVTPEQQSKIVLVKEHTHNNNVLEAHRLVAEIAEFNRARKVFEALQVIYEVEGEMNNDVYAVTIRWRQILYDWIGKGRGGYAAKIAKRNL